jgi:hypothetical protein
VDGEYLEDAEEDWEDGEDYAEDGNASFRNPYTLHKFYGVFAVC